jgi:LacI family transcriptional regulator
MEQAENNYVSKSPVTLKEVAEAAKVSIATASYSLNNSGSVGANTRKKVIEIAKQLGYQPNTSAKAMLTGKTGIIGLLMPDFTNPFFSQLTQAVLIAARQLNYEVIISNSMGNAETEKNGIDALTKQGIEGLIWFPIDELSSSSINLQIPTVVIDRYFNNLDCIVADCEAGGEMAAKYLIDNGHKKIGLINGPLDVKSSRLRSNGARNYLTKFNALEWEYESAYSYDLDDELVKLILQKKVTAIITGADVIAIGVLRVAQKIGISVPHDLSIIGFDNIPWTELSQPALTTINYPVTEIGTESVTCLLRRLLHPTDPQRKTEFPTVLVVRDSVSNKKTLSAQ